MYYQYSIHSMNVKQTLNDTQKFGEQNWAKNGKGPFTENASEFKINCIRNVVYQQQQKERETKKGKKLRFDTAFYIADEK